MRIADKRIFSLGLLVALLALLADQVSKAWLVSLFASGHAPIEILPVFDLVMVWNTGISFGMFSGHRQAWPLIILSAVIVAMLLRWLAKNTSKLTAAALGLIIGGATGNVVDRLRFGAVADFFDAHLGRWHWPAFNIADSVIFIGVVLLCAASMFTGNHPPREGTPP